MSGRIYNFSAGPAVLPVEVVETVKENLLNYQGSGLGVMEMSHRGPQFKEIIESAESNLKELLDINDDYEVIFTTGGASNQFSAVPLNLCPEGKTADYVVSGSWAKKALKEASRFKETNVAGDSSDKNFSYIQKDLNLSANSAYLHFTSNNTIAGTQYRTEPEVGDVPLVCDASSDLLHKKLDVSKYGLIYAGAQKNLGPAGVTVVIIRKDLLERIPENLPTMLDYRTYVEGKSLANTPPTFPIYVVGEVFKWLKSTGGLDARLKLNEEKAAVLYDYVESTDFYQALAVKEDRSLMNVTFKLSNEELQDAFLKEAKSQGLDGLKGHRSVGGLRASIYNAFPKEGVVALVDFMKDFASKN